MKSTYDLYLINASDLVSMEYREATEAKIDGARDAMRHYNKLARKKLHSDEKEYERLRDKYEASESSIEWNKELLREMEDTTQ